ncbi:MAG: ribonuclease E inhibitor RraB [Planctomycetota bacterium]
MSSTEIPPPNALARSSEIARGHWEACAERLRAALADGQDPSAARPVTHVVALPSPEAADLFAEVAGVRGFTCSMEPGGEGSVHVRATRDDAIGLPHIHNVVMELTEFAAPYDGDHVGFE